MRIIVIATALVLLFAGAALAQLPAPHDLNIAYGCNFIALTWSAADSGLVRPVGYNVYRRIGEDGEWQLRNYGLVDLSFEDNEVIIGQTFYYGIRGDYGEFEGGWAISDPMLLPDPANFDYFIVGNAGSNDLNLWYQSVLDSLGFHGAIVSDVLPYCGDMLANLPLLWVVTLGNNDGDYWESTPKDLALMDYLNRQGRLFVNDYTEVYHDSLSSHYLFFEISTCTPDKYISIQGSPETFADGLSYQFADSQWGTILGGGFGYYSREVLIENGLYCGDADIQAERDGYKAVVNSVPLHLLLDNEQTGTRLQYFRRMLEYFDLITSVSNEPTPQPKTISLSAYPNPFNAQVMLSVGDLKQDGSVGIYDIAGRLIRKLPVSMTDSEILWDGKNEAGIGVSTGIYFAKVLNGHSAQSIKLTMLK